jgi:membrane protease YdiL (CAAX protease family)
MKHCKSPYIIYAVVMLAIFMASRQAFSKPYLGVIAAVLFLYIPIIFLFIRKQHPAFYGISKKGLFKSIARALLAAIIIFPVYIAGFYIYMKHVYGLDVVFSITGLIHQPQSLIFSLNTLFMVAIPEEVFYRGYLQSELRQCDKQKINLFGVKTGVSFLILNALFAAGHLIVIPDISRLAVFFPGLVFSWLREKDDNIAGSIIFHWLSDVLSFVLFSMLR